MELDKTAKKTHEQIQEDYTKRIQYFYDSYERSGHKNDSKAAFQGMEPILASDVNSNLAPWCFQLQLLLKRNFLNTARLPQTSYVKLIVTIITAVFCIILFQNCDGTQ